MKTKLKEMMVLEETRGTVLYQEVEEIYNDLKPFIKRLMRKYRIRASEEVFKEMVLYSYEYDYTTSKTDKESLRQNALERLRKAIIIAKRNGEKQLNSINMIKVFEKEVKRFKKMKSANSDEYLKLIAYHEVGHFILNEETKECGGKTIRVSIIGNCETDCAGINISTPYIDKEFKIATLSNSIEEIAVYLAGDISCEVFLGKRNDAILGDYETATRTVHAMILGTRMIPKGKYLGKTGGYLVEGKILYTLLSDKQKEELTTQTSKIMMKAERKAKKILKKKRKQAKILVEALIERGALTGEQARQLYYGKIKLSDLPPAKINYIK